MEKTILEERKKTIYQFICDEFYVPMKAKEMAVVLSVPKSQRSELQEVLDALVMDGRIEVTSKGKYIKSEGKILNRYIYGACKRFWICLHRGGRGRYLHPGITGAWCVSYGYGSGGGYF